MAMTDGTAKAQQGGAFAPLREKTFRTIWTASLFSNFGQLILGVGAAWEMTRLTSSASMVALVQTALMLPIMLTSVPAGAVADMFDRRKIAMAGLGFSIICATLLTSLAIFELTGPWVILAFCTLIGAGVALYSPAWQASISEQVSEENLPAAVALGTISYNVARSFGPALGGLVVLAAGAKAAFGINAVFYLPLFIAFFFWKRQHVPSRLPPERIDRAIVSGMRYAFHSASIRTVLTRAFLFGLAGATASALAPLIAKNLLHGDASTYGILLGASGVGAVIGALLVSDIRERLSDEVAIKLLSLICGLSLAAVGFSSSLIVTCIALMVAGGTNILIIALYNISVQLSAPRWVTARALSLYSSALTGGIAIGSGVWGAVANSYTIEVAMWASGAFMLTMPLWAKWLPLPHNSDERNELVELAHEPEVALGITMRSGPIVIEVDYQVDPDKARDFYEAMRKVQRVRQRNGGFDWSLSRDIADPGLWTEHYHCPTWGDYLRMRARYTETDMELQAEADAFHTAIGRPRIRRKLERPFGSVRWRAESPDPHQKTVGFIMP